MPYLDDVTSVFIKNIHEWAIPDVIDTLIYGLSNESYKGDDVKSIRSILADSIKPECFQPIIENYRILKEIDDFHDEWDPFEVETLEDFKKELCVSIY